MSFITKRERVFNEYDLFDLPARNEGKIKTYASCTDARAWSHFCSDKTEHLVEIIKRNNETVRPKYVPTEAIVNTLLSVKNAEITRLRHKIDEFEQMLAAYDQLDLTCDQKCDIASAHAAIRAANKELDDMYLDLDLSGYTEGIDSEAFETGKSRGDEVTKYTDEVEKFKGKETEQSGGDEWIFEKEPSTKTETKSNQIGSCLCDASTSAYDTRIDEMQETIILKDAKMSAMHNTIAVMEINVCEPYYIYADIYTALEKILCTLCQNIKYKQYLDVLTAGKDTRYIDMTGKILFKIKVLEKFCLALIAPCTQELKSPLPECNCCRAEIVTDVETTFALTSTESKKPTLDNKRAQLVADIMEHQEMQDILSKNNLSLRIDDEQLDDCYNIDNYSIDTENMNRLKKLQSNYEDMLNCYEKLKYERDGLYLQCQKYINFENECECLQNQLKEYNQLWKEKEYHKKRTEDLDKLKEKYYILSEETLDIETKLNAELEINKIKSATVDELRNENIRLEKKITETSMMFEKQKNNLVCKVKECECKIMCQEQQIRSLSQQIDNFLEQESQVKVPRNEDDSRSFQLFDQIESQKEQINNLKEAICCSEEEKKYLQEDYENKLRLMNELKFDVEDWKGKYETATQKNCYLEQYLQEFEQHVSKLQDKNSELNKEIELKSNAIENLNNILYYKSQENGNLIDQVDQTQNENKELLKKITNIENRLDSSLTSLENEKRRTLSTIRLAKQESLEVLNNIRLDDLNYQSFENKHKKIKNEDANNSDMDTKDIILTTDNISDSLLNEIKELRDVNIGSINTLQEENMSIKKSLDLVNRNSIILECKLKDHEKLKNNLNKLQKDNDKLMLENKRLEQDLAAKRDEIDGMLRIVEVAKKNSDSLIEQLNESEQLQVEFTKLDKTYKKLMDNKKYLEEKNINKDHKIDELVQNLHNLKKENDRISLETEHLKSIEYELQDLHKKYATLLEDKQKLQKDYDIKTEEINNLNNNLKKKIEENQDFCEEIEILQLRETSAINNITSLKNENYNIHTTFHAFKKESEALLEKLKQYEPLESQLKELKSAYHEITLEKEKLQIDLNVKLQNLHAMEQENSHLNKQTRELLAHSEVLENSLIQARDKTINNNPLIDENYDVIKKEIAKLKEEKLSQRQEIRNLWDQIENSEYVINSLNEDIIARDKKVTTLENHINELEDEIKKLHSNLEDVVETGEQIRQLSYEKMDQSLKSIEAHQSKTTHNMKIEITKLQDKKALLESQLSNTKLRSEETIKDKYKFIAQIKHLQNERLIMISDIKQLELKSTGDSNLTPNSKINDILTSLNRISKCMDNKNTTLEKTLLSVQASYQLLKSKADEAKILAEKERQKNFDEKEEAKIARKHIENQLEYLESKLKDEKSDYENIIKEMEREMLNQTLISEKIQQSKEDEVLKLKGDLYVFQNKVKELQENEENVEIKYKDIINSLKLAVKEKKRETLLLQKHLESLNSKKVSNFGNQTICLEMHNNISTQTDHYNTSTTQKAILDSLISNEVHNNTMYGLPVSNNFKERTEKNVIKSELLPTDTPTSINEVQILTAQIEPKIDFVKNLYIHYKIKRLSPSKVEQCSISEVLNEHPKEPISSHVPFISSNDNIVSIYNTTTLTTTIKDDTSIAHSTNKAFETTKSSNTRILQTADTNKSLNETNDFEPPSSLIDPLKPQADKDFFVIYTDTESMYEYQSGKKNYSPISYNLALDNQETILYEPEEPPIHTRKLGKQRSYPLSKSDYEDRDDDSLKLKLDINLPRVTGDSPSTWTSIADKKSLDSYTKAIYVSPTRVVYSDTNISSTNNNTHQDLFTLQSRLKDILKERGEEKTIKSNKKDLHGKLENAIELNEKQQFEKNNISSKAAHHELMRQGAEILSKTVEGYLRDQSDEYNIESNNGLQYIINAMQNELNPNNIQHFNTNSPLHKSYSDQQLNISNNRQNSQLSPNFSSVENRTMSTSIQQHHKSVQDYGVLAKLDTIEVYEIKIEHLTNALKNIKVDYKKKIEAIKIQYDSNVKSIINEHNQGVVSIQSLHEETLHDIVKIHENETENLRSMSIEAMRKADKLEKENQLLRLKLQEQFKEKNYEEPIKITTPEVKRKKYKSRVEEKTLTKTNVEKYNIKPKRRAHGPCTCSFDMNPSEAVRNIFEQVDVEQRKIAEQTYLKYIANKILGATVESLDAQELSFLHLKVCRTWKTKLNKEEALQKRIDCLETELIKKQLQTQKHMAELDRKVAVEWQRLQEVREAVCRSPPETRDDSPSAAQRPCSTKKEICNGNSMSCNITMGERRSAGDLQPRISRTGLKMKRGKMESNRAVLVKLDAEEGRQRKLLSDETPTRLKRSHDRQHLRTNKKRDI